MKLSKKITKTLILSGATALAFGAVAAGTTYALFTSNAENEIVVTSGKVSVTSTIEVKEKYRPASISQSEGNEIVDSTNIADSSDLEVGVEGNSVKIAKMLPGDKVTLTVTPKNNSNVKIKYRETYSFVGDATSDLKITGDENMVKLWTELGVGEDIEAYEIVVELPTTATTEIEETTIKLGIEAVQGNAQVVDEVVKTQDELQAAIDALKTSTDKNLVVTLSEDLSLTSPLEVNGNVTIYGTTKEDGSKTKITAPSDGAENQRSITVNDNTDPVSLTLVGIDVEGPTTGSYTRGITLGGNKDLTLIMDDCSISTNYYALNLASGNEKANIHIRNSTLKGWAAVNVWSPNTETKAVFENCVLIGDSISKEGFPTISLYDCDNSELTFKGCTIKANELGNSTDEPFQLFFYSDAKNSKATFSDCSFYKTYADIGEIKLSSSEAASDWMYASESSSKTIVDGVSYSYEE